MRHNANRSSLTAIAIASVAMMLGSCGGDSIENLTQHAQANVTDVNDAQTLGFPVAVEASPSSSVSPFDYTVPTILPGQPDVSPVAISTAEQIQLPEDAKQPIAIPITVADAPQTGIETAPAVDQLPAASLPTPAIQPAVVDTIPPTPTQPEIVQATLGTTQNQGTTQQTTPVAQAASPIQAQTTTPANAALTNLSAPVDSDENVTAQNEPATPAISPQSQIPSPPSVNRTSAGANNNAVPKGWPDGASDSLPLAGIFYGNYKAGLSTGNGPLAAHNAIRFRAERTGTVDAVRYNNRRILPTDIENRCELYGAGSPWCECKDNGLDYWSCGYTLSNAYHVGNGGLITIELRNDDGTPNHFPGSKVLAQTDSYQPALMSIKFPTLAFTKPVQIQAGQIYHLVFRNDKPPTCDVRKLSVQAAAACPRNEGAIGISGTKHSGDESEGSRFGPMLGDISGRILYKGKANQPWKVSSDIIALYELKYSDNEYIGNTYTGFRNSNYKQSKGGSRVIEGNTIARQAFTVEDATREVDGLWLNYGHAYDRPANGKSLAVTLKGANGNTIASTRIPAAMACSTRARNAVLGKAVPATRDEWMCRKWGYAALPKPVSLMEGSSYVVEFAAPQGAAFALSSYFSYHNIDERNMWDNARAEISRNGGTSWEKWTGNYFSSRDLPVVFTIVGMPRELP